MEVSNAGWRNAARFQYVSVLRYLQKGENIQLSDAKRTRLEKRAKRGRSSAATNGSSNPLLERQVVTLLQKRKRAEVVEKKIKKKKELQ